MNRVLRAVINCLLLVAVPLQGYAAGGMLFCGAGAATPAAVAHHHDDSASAVAHVAHHHDVAAVDADDAGAPNLHGAMHGKCSACSACCSVAALPSAPIAATTVPPPAAAFSNLEHANPGHGPARLERPPRLNLA